METMIPTNITTLKRKIYKIAKKYEISMTGASEKEIEVCEENKDKLKLFVREINKINEDIKIVDLIAGNEYTSV